MPVEDFLIDLGSGESAVVRFERASPDDAEVARTLIDVDLQNFTEATFSRYAARALLQHGAVFLLRYAGEVIGTAVCIRTWRDPAEALLLSMGLLHGWRGRRLGSRFVSCILRELAADGFESVALEIASINERAVRVYRELGFEVVGEEAAVEDERVRLLTLRCRLPAAVSCLSAAS